MSQQQPLLVMWPGGAYPNVKFPLKGGKRKTRVSKRKTRVVKRKTHRAMKKRSATRKMMRGGGGSPDMGVCRGGCV